MSPPDSIVVMRGPGETRSALLRGDTVLEVVHQRDAEIQTGAAVAGRVVGHASGLAFVDIGDALPGVLKSKAPLVEGAAVTVRVVVPARGGKGAALARAERSAPAPHPATVWWRKYEATITVIEASPAATLRALKAALPDAPVQDGGNDPFARHGIDAAIEAALAREILLDAGARVIIDVTAAATMIDIDAGPMPAAQANAAALPVIAEALRLRNLGGHLLIDAIPTRRGAAKAWAADLAGLVADDPVETQIAGVTPLGMIELTRRRCGLSLAEQLGDAPRAAAYRVLRQAPLVATAGHAARLRLMAAPAVIDLLQQALQPALREAERLAACQIRLETRPEWGPSRAELAPD